ncbi:MAG: hypothetical protein P8Z79_00835 [Sedimentisphaerales bacterium]
MSIQPTKLIIASLALAVICLAGRIMDLSKTVVVTPGSGTATIQQRTQARGTVARTGVVPAPAQTRERITELDIYAANHEAVNKYIEAYKGKAEGVGVFHALWHFSTSRFQGAVDSVFAFDLRGLWDNITGCVQALGWALRYHTLYCIIFLAIILAVISIAAGAICRIAALQFARSEKPGLTEALRYSTKRFVSYFTTPLAPFGIIAFMGVFVVLLGLMGNIPLVGEIIVGLGLPLALLAGALITVILIGAVAGFGMMFPAIAYDGSDCFDAISRSFSYVYARPWHMLFYTSIAAVYGSICYTFVRLFAFLSLWITRFFVQISLWTRDSTGQANKLEAIWPKPELGHLLGSSGPVPTSRTESVGAFLIYLFLLVVLGLVVSFIISFYFSANTIIYSLMRGKVDNTPREDIYMPFEEADVEPVVPRSEPEREEPPSPEPETPPDSDSSQE